MSKEKTGKIMNTKFISFFGSAFLVVSALTSCRQESNPEDLKTIEKLRNENRSLTEELRKSGENLVKAEAELKKAGDIREESRVDHNLEAFPERDSSFVYFPLYKTGTGGTSEVSCYTAIPSNTTLDEKLKLLTSEISGELFEGYHIEFLGTENSGGILSASINLKDSEGKDWNTFLSDSETYSDTMNKLNSTYLQKGYVMDWIDELKIKHNGTEL